MSERILELAKQAGLKFPSEIDLSPPEKKFAELILEEVMQELFINGHEDAFDFLNKHLGVDE